MFQIITDTTADLSQCEYAELGVKVLKFRIICGSDEYVADASSAECNYNTILNALKNNQKVTTSGINGYECEMMFRQVLDSGRDILFLSFLSTLSGSYNLACQVAERLREEYPSRQIEIFDSGTGALGLGYMVCVAAQEQQQGKSLLDVYATCMDLKQRTKMFIILDTTEYLVRGGRLKRHQHMIAKTLNIKPIITLNEEGELVPLRSVIGRRKAIKSALAMYSHSTENNRQPVLLISHADCQSAAEAIAAGLIEQGHRFARMLIRPLDMALGAHSGPNALVLFGIA